MADYIVVQRVKLTSLHRPTGKTLHLGASGPLPPPTELQIVVFPEPSAYYLLHFDTEGVEMGDTYHDSLEDALAQAEREFQIRPDEWEVLSF